MASRRLGAGTALVVIVVAAVLGSRWWAGDERAVRKQMSVIAEALTVRAEEGSLGPVTRLATLRNALAPDVRLSSGPRPTAGQGTSTRMPPEVIGRDAVLGLVSRSTPPPGGVTVRFVDTQVTLDESGASAEVYCTATVESRAASGEPTVDARELVVGFVKSDGDWLVSSVRVEETLMR